jgi:hypothetical protein
MLLVSVGPKVITLSGLHCIINEKTKICSQGGDYNALRKSADIALLMTTDGDSCGIAWQDMISTGETIGVVARSCATGYYSTGHEIGHMFGCYHNKEASGLNPTYKFANGFLMNPHKQRIQNNSGVT